VGAARPRALSRCVAFRTLTASTGLIDEEGVRLALQHGTYLVPDVYTDVYIIAEGPAMGLPDIIIDKERELRKHQTVNWCLIQSRRHAPRRSSSWNGLKC